MVRLVMNSTSPQEELTDVKLLQYFPLLNFLFTYLTFLQVCEYHSASILNPFAFNTQFNQIKRKNTYFLHARPC